MPNRELGPWRVVVKAGETCVESDDFSHDVTIIVRGDLGKKKQAYAEAICKILAHNMPMEF